MGNKTGSEMQSTSERISDIIENTHFKKREVKKHLKQFGAVSSTGSLTRAQFVTLYNTISSCYNANLLAEHMFRVFARNNSYSITFDEFIKCLSVTTRGIISTTIIITYCQK